MEAPLLQVLMGAIAGILSFLGVHLTSSRSKSATDTQTAQEGFIDLVAKWKEMSNSYEFRLEKVEVELREMVSEKRRMAAHGRVIVRFVDSEGNSHIVHDEFRDWINSN